MGRNTYRSGAALFIALLLGSLVFASGCSNKKEDTVSGGSYYDGPMKSNKSASAGGKSNSPAEVK